MGEFEKLWSTIEIAIDKLMEMILDGVDPAMGFDPGDKFFLSGDVSDMYCLDHDYRGELYDMTRAAIEDCTQQLAFTVEGDGYMLLELSKCWTKQNVMVNWFKDTIDLLDDSYTQFRRVPKLMEVGYTTFRNLVYNPSQSKAKDDILQLIDREREGKPIARPLLKNGIECFVQMGKYEEDFENFMLQATAFYYTKASSWTCYSWPVYMQKYEECLKKERERVTHYLHPNTEPKLVKILQMELLDTVANKMCCDLLNDDKMDDLSKMWSLFHEFTPGLESIADVFKQYVIDQGEILIKQTDNETSNQLFISNVIELHKKYRVYVTECFQNHSLFDMALTKAFEKFFNEKVAVSSSAELLAMFCHNILGKREGEKLNDEAFKDTIDNVCELLRYSSDKHIFFGHYRKLLAVRLLSTSYTLEQEKTAHEKLSKNYYLELSWSFVAMMRDMALARINQKKFMKHLTIDSLSTHEIDLTVNILNDGIWPMTYETYDLNLPTEMANCLEVFEAFYKIEYEKRKLAWKYSLGTCNIIGNFIQRPIELVVSTYQAAVLLLFNDKEKLSYTDIFEQLKLHSDVQNKTFLTRLLHSLSCEKYKILTKEPHSNSVSDNDLFAINYKFTCEMKKTVIAFEDELKIDESKIVNNDRRFAVEAVLVHIMKQKKSMEHQQLVNECCVYLSKWFKPDKALIKERIENLIERDYLERDEDNPQRLKYVP